MTKDEALELALEVMKLANSSHNMVLTSDPPQSAWRYHNVDMKLREAISAIRAALEAKDEPVAQGSIQHLKIMMEESAWEGRIELSDVLANIDEFYTTTPQLEAKDEPYAFEASMYPSVIIDPVTGNVSIGTVTKACGLECDCTDVCKQDDYKALWQQMCERCDELDKKLAQRKPLTDEEIKSQWSVFWEADCHPWAIDFARAIEAKLKEKNT